MKQVLIFIFVTISVFVKADQECIVFSNGERMMTAHYHKGVFQLDNPLWERSNLMTPVWPSFSEVTGVLIFEAMTDTGYGIYKANIKKSFQDIEFLTNGRYSAISPRGNKIAFFNDHNRLVVKEIPSERGIWESKSYNELSFWQRPLWVSNNKLVYVGRDNKVFMFDVDKSSHDELTLEMKALYPVAVSGESILFIDHSAKTLSKYKNGQFSMIFENDFLSLGPGIIVTKNSILYARQTWPEILSLSESKSIFDYSTNKGLDKEVIGNSTLFGGVLIPCDH
jgi:hypothetical protein